MATLFKAVGMMAVAALLAGGCSDSGEGSAKSTTMTPAPAAAPAAMPAAAPASSGMMDSMSNSTYAQAIRRVIEKKDDVVAQTGGGGAVSPETGKQLAAKLGALDLSGTPGDFQAAFQKVVAALSSIPQASNSAVSALPNVSVSQWTPLASVTSAIAQLEAVSQKYGIANAGGTLKP